MKKCYLLLIGALLMCVSGCKTKDADVINVACNLPMTGDFALYGQSVREGILMAQKDYLDSMGKFGINIIYDFQDNQSNSKDAVTVFRKQDLQGYDIYISGITQQTASIMPLQSKSKKPHFIWSYTPLVLSKDDNLFRTWVDYPQEADCFIKYLSINPQFKRIACIYPNAESAQTLFNQLFIPRLPQGCNIVFNEAFDVSTSNFKDVVLRIKSKSPDIIFVNGWDNHLPNLIKEITINGLKKEGNLVFTFDLMDAVPKISSELLDGLIANIPSFMISHSEKYKEWGNRFEKVFGKVPNYTNAYAYDLGNIIFSAAKKNKQSPEISFKEALLTTDFYGITGYLGFTPEGILKGSYVTSIFCDSTFIPLTK